MIGRRSAVVPFLALVLAMAPVRAAFAQDQEEFGKCDTAEVVDRVVAVVGDAPVLASQVEEDAFQRRAQGQQIHTPEEFHAFCRQVLGEIIDAELLVQQAKRDTSIKVTDQEIADGVEQQVRNVRSKFTSEVDYRTELKKAGFQTPEEYRRWLADQQRRAALSNRLIEKLKGDKKLEPVSPTEREMREYFEKQKAQLGKRPATISFRQVIVAPQPTAEAKLRALALADSILRELRKGADFATAAKRFSQDPGSREQGGELNWFRRGEMVPAFEREAFRLKPGVVSDPVETPYGYHLIQVQRVQPGEVQARHILIMPEITPADADSAARLAERIRDAIIAGAPIDSLQRLYHDPELDKDVEDVPVDKMLPEYRAAIGDADSGAVLPVFKMKADPEIRSKYVVLVVKARHAEGDVRYEDVRDRIHELLGQELAVRRYLDRLRASNYVDIRS